MNLKEIFTINARVSGLTHLVISCFWAALFLFLWATLDLGVIPTLGETLSALAVQWSQGAFYEMLTSLLTSLESLAWAMGIGLGLCYLSTIPAFRAPVALLGQLRFLSLIGLTLIFVLYAPDNHGLRVAVLTFAILGFLVNSMLQVIDDIPRSRYDHARTMGLSRFGVLREVVIRGTLGNAFDSMRMNAAMAWMMLTAVEGLARSDGGIGVLLLNLNRTQDYAAIFGIQMMILLTGLGQDLLIKYLKLLVCPYTRKA